MNKEENTVTISLDTYMDLISRASLNEMMMNEMRNCNMRIYEFESRLNDCQHKIYELEQKRK